MKINRFIIRAFCLFGLWIGLGLQAHAQTDTVTYVYTDPQGTPLVKADAAGNVIARYDYTPYGNAVTSLGSPPNGPGYTGHVNDPETGLVYMQARYYQPDGRFLSPDPVRPAPGDVYRFNRYDYANNSPIRNIDPDGRYTCDAKNNASFCGKIDTYVNRLHDSLKGIKFGSREYRTVSKAIAQIGEKGKGGPNYVSGELKGKTIAQTNQHGTTTVDVSKVTGARGLDMAAGSLGHEAQHDIDAQKWGAAGETQDRNIALKEFRRTETNAYETQAAVEHGLGSFLNANDLREAINASVGNDLNAWDSHHEDQK